ncbi:hypothetical protein Moror_5406 [Moniliophthora roreri MCA 2997]|uniref:Uncharacterized protein n=1 Tax=Moniliophthora roreri (strain MCA 2997) TaxID=1381753 RepID=V2WQB1_MONRO|nr:hypothetical protein Moror_5406 [Moniliophthora roreri MCA 2997]
MSNATSSSASDSSNYHGHDMPVPPASSGLRYEDDITYTRPFNPSPFELLFLVNTRGHNDTLQNASMGQPHLQFAIDSLIRLQAQCTSLNAIIEETNVYAANLAFNATASRPTPLQVEGPMMVPSFPINPERLEFHLCHQLSGLGPLPMDVCDANPNDPIFLRAAEMYRARIGAALELALDQTHFCPRRTRTEPVLSREAGPSSIVSEQHSPSNPDSSAALVYPLSPSTGDSTPLYAQSIGVTLASPSPAPKSIPEPAPTPSRFDPFNVNDEPDAPASVPFLASGRPNPAFISIRNAVRANPGIQIDTRAFTNPPPPYNYLTHVSFSMGRRERIRNHGTG